jgi:hypothetical protein
MVAISCTHFNNDSAKEYPWFKDATILALGNVELLHGHHLFWPKLDVDLSTEILESPEKYPLTFSVSNDKHEIPSPAWHASILEQRRKKIASGKAHFITLEQLKNHFKRN